MTGRAGVRLCGVVLAAFVVLSVRVLEAQVDQSIDQSIDQAQVHVVEIVADKDSSYKSPDGGKPEITLKAESKSCCGFRRARQNRGTATDRSTASRFCGLATGPKCKAGTCYCARASRNSN